MDDPIICKVNDNRNCTGNTWLQLEADTIIQLSGVNDIICTPPRPQLYHVIIFSLYWDEIQGRVLIFLMVMFRLCTTYLQ